MRKLACKLAISVVAFAGAAAAQNPTNALKQQRTSAAETVSNSQRERLQWEAAETWSRPAAPHEQVQSTSHSIHIESEYQPRLTLPKLRREWLQPSMEAAPPQSIADSSQRR